MHSVAHKLRRRWKGERSNAKVFEGEVGKDALTQKMLTRPYGLLKLYEGPEPIVDIIVVHGLNGHREKTWTAPNNVLWLRDLLPSKIPRSRILTWGYDADTQSKFVTDTQFIHDHARNLISDLALRRSETHTEKRPIIFVCHSLGGLVVKSALIHSHLATAQHLPHHRSVKISTYGILFFGTPHQGGEGVAWGKRAARIASIYVNTNTRILHHLERDSEWLQRQLQEYASISNSFVTKFAYETYPTPIFAGGSLVIVPKASAVVPGAMDAEPLAIMANHLDMVKYPNQDDDGYQRVSGHLSLMVQKVDAAVRVNWERENQSQMIYGNPLNVQYLESDYIKLVDKLYFPGCDVREESISPAWPGTLDWILKDDRFRDWMESKSGLFWLNGKPGSGKSTTMKHIVNAARTKQSPSLKAKFSVQLAFFFNHQGSAFEKKMTGLLRSLLLELLKLDEDLFSHIAHDFLKAKERQELSETLLVTFSKTLLSKLASNEKIVLFIDALDECQGSLRQHIEFLKDLVQYVQASGSTLHICVASRPLSATTAWLGQGPKLNLEENNAQDISTYVRAKTKCLMSAANGSIYTDFVQNIVDRADGVFLWVVMVTKELLDGWESSDTIAQLDQRLTQIPKELDRFFGRMLEKIPEVKVRDALAMFRCVLGAQRPLTLSELQSAVAFGSYPFSSLAEWYASGQVVTANDALERRIQSCCGGLLEVVGSSLRVQFIHQSVGEFLATKSLPKSLFLSQEKLAEEANHEHLLNACLNYLSIQEMERIPEHETAPDEHHHWRDRAPDSVKIETFERFPFLTYSLEYWVKHYVRAATKLGSHYDQVTSFFMNNHFLIWYRLYCYLCADGWDGYEPPLVSFAAEHNFFTFLEDHIAIHGIKDFDDSEFGGPLQAAVVHGRADVVRLLLDNGADVNAKGGKFGTAMAAAITLKQDHIIGLLKERGADVELCTPLSPYHIYNSSGWSGHRNPFSRPAESLSEPPKDVETWNTMVSLDPNILRSWHD